MSIIPLTVYVLTVYGLLNVYIANGKPLFGKSDGKIHSAPQAQFQPLSEDWLKSLQNEDFHEVETDNGRGGNSQSGVNSRTEATTASSLGFDFNYLFNDGSKNKKPSNNGGWGNPQADNQNKNKEQNVKPNFHLNIRPNNQNQQSFGFNNQDPFQNNVPLFDPFNIPFQQAPSFNNFGRSGYSRNRGPVPAWGRHGYSNRLGFALPPLFMGGFGGY